MRKLIEFDTIDEPVKRFLGGLEISSEAAVVEVDGRRIFLVVRPANGTARAEMPWTEESSRRRNELVDRRIDASLTPSESVELAELEEGFDRHLNRVAPLPIAYARSLLTKIDAEITPPGGAP